MCYASQTNDSAHAQHERVEYINCQDHRGWTALHFAAEGGHIQCARLLMEASADPSIVNNQGLTASEVARDAGHVACAAFLDGYALMNSVLQPSM